MYICPNSLSFLASTRTVRSPSPWAIFLRAESPILREEEMIETKIKVRIKRIIVVIVNPIITRETISFIGRFTSEEGTFTVRYQTSSAPST